jgi:hypothetical protein
MQHIIPKNWSRETLFSFLALALAYISWYALDNITFDTYKYTTFFVIEQWLYDFGWYYILSDLWDWFAPLVSLVFTALAFYTATLSVKKTSDNKEKGRIFGLVFASISGFVLVMAFLALLISITSDSGMLLFSSRTVSLVFEILAAMFIAYSFYIGVKHLGNEKKKTAILAFWILSNILLILLVVGMVYSYFFPQLP